jgi:hypothetical protein
MYQPRTYRASICSSGISDGVWCPGLGALPICISSHFTAVRTHVDTSFVMWDLQKSRLRRHPWMPSCFRRPWDATERRPKCHAMSCHSMVRVRSEARENVRAHGSLANTRQVLLVGSNPPCRFVCLAGSRRRPLTNHKWLCVSILHSQLITRQH